VRMARLVGAIFVVVAALLIGCRGEWERATDKSGSNVNLTAPPGPAEVRDEFVKDESAAIKIALDTWVPIYGKEQIEGERPYEVELRDGIWTVKGSLPQGWDGGVAIARISQKDGKVLQIGHGK